MVLTAIVVVHPNGAFLPLIVARVHTHTVSGRERARGGVSEWSCEAKPDACDFVDLWKMLRMQTNFTPELCWKL